MYTDFFGLAQTPFSIAPDPRYVYMSERHREALAHLLYGLTGGGGFVLLTGEIGTGKTTVCRLFLEQIPEHCNVAYIFNPRLSVKELLQSICDEFGVTVAASNDEETGIKAYIDALNVYLLATHAGHQHNILIIDEAQNLSVDVLEQLRLLTNLETNERKLLQIILIGQPELRAMLAKGELEQLAQRVIARFHLDALSLRETGQYIAHRMAVAGFRNALPFSAAALRRIHRHARGIPRRINLLCDRALLGAYAKGKRKVTARTVDIAASEVFAPPLKSSGRFKIVRRTTAAAVAIALVTGALFLYTGQAPALAELPQIVRATVADALSKRGSDAETEGRPITAVPSGSSGPSAPGALAVPASETGPEVTPEPPAQAAPTSPAATEIPGEPLPVTTLATADSAAAAPPTQKADLVEEPAPAKPEMGADTEPAKPGIEARNLAAAYRSLASRWGLTIQSRNPCEAMLQHRVTCFAGNGGLVEIRLLDRPVILHLLDEQGESYYALLTGLFQQAAVLQMGETTQRVSLAALAKGWRGRFYTLWRMPEGYRRELKLGERGAPVDWLAGQFAQIDKNEAPAENQVFDRNLRERVRAFQLAEGLRPTGVAGPQTFMRLAAVTRSGEPTLDTDIPLPGNVPRP